MTSSITLITLRMALCAAAFSLVILLHWSPVEASTTVLADSPAAVRSTKLAGGNKTVDGGCPSRCGNLTTFVYPFGIGPDCSRGPDFSLICDDASRRPKLFLRDGITEVLDSIQVDIDGWYRNCILVSIWRAIPMKSGAGVYNMSLETPGRSFSFDISIMFNVTGCDLDVYWIDQTTSMSMLGCSTWCPGGEEIITEMAASYNCSGMGCCSVLVQDVFQKSIQLSFVHRKSSSSIGASTSSSNRQTSLLRDRITIVTTNSTVLSWTIVDQPNCASAKKNRAEYACISNHSHCIDDTTFGYTCECEQGFTGNAYIIDGCTDYNIDGTPSTLVSIIGYKQYRRSARDMYYFLQSNVCIKQLAYAMLEQVLVTVFPELRQLIDDIHEKGRKEQASFTYQL